MHSYHRSILAALAVLALMTASQATAVEILGNRGLSSQGTQIGGENPPATGVAQRFTFGSSNPQNLLDSIQLGLVVKPASSNLDKLIFAIYSNDGSNDLPGSEFARFSSTPVGGFIDDNVHLYTFNFASGTQTLTANTSYWIVATYVNQSYTPGTSTPSMNWRDSAPPTTAVARNGFNVTWNAAAEQSGFGAWAINTDDNNLRFSLILVPEPSTYALGAVSTLVMGSIARRRARKAANA